MITMESKLIGTNMGFLHFGSQSEGTTTTGLNSDIDFLVTRNDINIMTHWRDWEAGMDNLLILRVDPTPPQQYLLKVIKHYTPEPVTSIDDDVYVWKDFWASTIKRRTMETWIRADSLRSRGDNQTWTFCEYYAKLGYCTSILSLQTSSRNTTLDRQMQR